MAGALFLSEAERALCHRSMFLGGDSASVSVYPLAGRRPALFTSESEWAPPGD